MIDWPKWLDWMVRDISGPEDEPDPAVNGDIDSLSGEEDDESGFDDMPVDCGWEDESDDDGDDHEEGDYLD